jgi:hypothetical protein
MSDEIVVDHPPHYQHVPNIECIDVIEHFPFNLAAAMKHIWRAGNKEGMPFEVDLDKAIWYLNREKLRHSNEGDK